MDERLRWRVHRNETASDFYTTSSFTESPRLEERRWKRRNARNMQNTKIALEKRAKFSIAFHCQTCDVLVAFVAMVVKLPNNTISSSVARPRHGSVLKEFTHNEERRELGCERRIYIFGCRLSLKQQLKSRCHKGKEQSLLFQS